MSDSALLVKEYFKQMWDQKIAYETSPVTMSRIKVIWDKSLAPFWADIEPQKINAAMVTEFILWHKKNRPGVQLVNVFKYLGNLFAVMIESGAMELSKRPKLELPKDEQKHHAKQKGRYITDDEFRRMLPHFAGQMRLLFLVAYSCGMRKMEIGKLESSRLQFDGKRFVAILNTDNTKTGLARQVPFPESLNEMVRVQLALNSRWVFVSRSGGHCSPQDIDIAWKKSKNLAGITGRMRWHDIRHTCASNFAKSDISATIACTILGMSLSTYQKIYLKLTAQDLVAASESSLKRIGGIC